MENSSISTLVVWLSTFHLFIRALSLSRFFSVRFAVYHIRDRERDVLFCSSPMVKKLQLLLRVSVNPLSFSLSPAHSVPLQFYNIFFLTKEKVIKFVKKAIICLNLLIFFSIFFPHRFLWFIYIDKVSLMPLPSLFFSRVEIIVLFFVELTYIYY